MSLHHGGDLDRASREFGLPREQWLDLSTGISPWAWPVPDLPVDVWRRLPERGDGLGEAAAAYYGCPTHEVLAVPGSQFAIETLPALADPGGIALPEWGYDEHRAAWTAAGHAPRFYRDGDDLLRVLDAPEVRHAVVINPGNPTAEVVAPAALRTLAAGLAARHGLLVVDEAFADPSPALSLAPERPPNTVVLRSVGKFFGLAGLRLGFAIGPPDLLAALATRLPPWAVNHPARWIGRQALADTPWQRLQRRRLAGTAPRWQRALTARLPALAFRGCALFASGAGDWALCRRLYRAAGERGMLLRLLGPRAGTGILRFGLPAEDRETEALGILEEIA